MSRSVSAPSSVTKTSPCWNGLIVPGSTFRYGSNFCSETVSPRLSSRQPIDAAAIPFPSEETTPPVTKMYLAIRNPRELLPHRHDQLSNALKVCRRIDTERFIICLDHSDPESVFERSQLFQPFGAFERSGWQIG